MSAAEVVTVLNEYYLLTHNNREVISNIGFFAGIKNVTSMTNAILAKVPDHMRKEIDDDTSSVIGHIWGPEHGQLASETQLWSWGNDIVAPTEGWPTPFVSYPFRAIQIARTFHKAYGLDGLGAVAAAMVETGPMLVEDSNSYRRDMANTILPRKLYVRRENYKSDLDGGPNPDDVPENTVPNPNNVDWTIHYGLYNQSLPKSALVTHLFAASLGLDGPRAILGLWEDPALLYSLGLTRPNDLWSEAGRLRAVFEHYLVTANADKLRLFTIGPQRLPLSSSALFARPGEPVLLPRIDTWRALVHAYLPRHHRDIWSSMAALPMPEHASDSTLHDAAAHWCDIVGRPCDWSNKTGATTQLWWWLRALSNGWSTQYGRAISEVEQWAKDVTQVPLGTRNVSGETTPLDTVKSVARVVVLVATVVASAAGTLTGASPVILAAGMSLLAFLSNLALTPEGAVSETLLWVSRLRMPLDQVSVADQIVIQQIANNAAQVKSTVDKINAL